MNPLLVWQLVDSAFPTGGFAHSCGLEAAVQLGEVRGPGELERFAVEAARSAASFGLPFACAAHATPDRLGELDRRIDAATPSHVARRASRAQGEALLRAAAAAFGAVVPAVTALAARARGEGLPCHHAPVHGAVLAALGVPVEDARRLFVFGQLRAVASAAVRLGVCGPLEAQALQARLAAPARAWADAAAGVAVEDAAQETPLVELFQAHQDRLYSRLFRS